MNTKRKHFCTIAVMLCLGGCSSFQRVPVEPSSIAAPLIDMANVTDLSKFQRDLEECQQYASTVNPARGAQGAAIAGAILGLAVGSLMGDSSFGSIAAGVTAVGAGAETYSEGKGKQEGIMQRCMSGRGYMVIG